MHLFITCPPGLAQICKQELKHLWYTAQVLHQTGLIVTDETTAQDVIKLNLRLRTANKVFLILDRRQTTTFDELFEGIGQQERAERVQKQQPILVEASSYRSPLTSIPTIQSIAKKAIVSKLTGDRDTKWVENKGIEPFAITVMCYEEYVLVLINSSGESLHRRWYRTETGDAPIKENIAAGMVLSSGRRFHEPLYDPCCGSGTFCIEAAMIAKNIAPWLLRSFAFQSRKWYRADLFEEIKAIALTQQIHKSHTIHWSDIDPMMIEKATINAKQAWLEGLIHFEVQDCLQFDKSLCHSASALISNPPYGQRMQQDNIHTIHKYLFSLFESRESKLHGWICTGYLDIQPFYPRSRESKKLKNWAEDIVFWKKK